MPCYDAISTCAATGERAAQSSEEHPDPAQWLGPGTSWNQPLAFEWASLRARLPSEYTEYCTQRIEELKQKGFES